MVFGHRSGPIGRVIKGNHEGREGREGYTKHLIKRLRGFLVFFVPFVVAFRS